MKDLRPLRTVANVVAGPFPKGTGSHSQALRLTCVAWLFPMLLFLTISTAAHAQGTTADSLAWSASNSQVTITGYSDTGGAVSISGTINGLPVTSIGDYAFKSCTNVTSMVIADGVASIEPSAFQGCTDLTSVTIPGSVTSIGSDAFNGCSNLASAMFMGNAPSMGGGAFASTALGFTAYYYNSATGFSSPTWDGYPAVNLGPGYPIVSSGTSTGIRCNGAALNGTMNPDGLATTYYFQFGTTASFGSTTGSQSGGSGTTAISVSAPLTGLIPATTYYYDLVVTNSRGTTYGPLQTFTTSQTLGSATTAAQIAQSGSNIQVSVPSLVGYSYQLQRASSLSGTATWQPIGSAQPGTNAALTFVDSGGALLNSAFYHIRIPQ